MTKLRFWLFLVSATISLWSAIALLVGGALSTQPPLISQEIADIIWWWAGGAFCVFGVIASLALKKEYLYATVQLYYRLLDRFLDR